GLWRCPLGRVGLRAGGVLKRLRATPARPGAFLGAQVGVNAVVCLAGIGLLMLAGALIYDLRAPAHPLPFLGLLVLSAGAAFGLGLLIAALAPSETTAVVLANVVFFPMIFLTGATLPREIMPTAMERISDALPLSYAVRALQWAWLDTGGDELPLALGVLGATIVVCAAVAARTFRWESSGDGAGNGRSARRRGRRRRPSDRVPGGGVPSPRGRPGAAAADRPVRGPVRLAGRSAGAASAGELRRRGGGGPHRPTGPAAGQRLVAVGAAAGGESRCGVLHPPVPVRSVRVPAGAGGGRGAGAGGQGAGAGGGEGQGRGDPDARGSHPAAGAGGPVGRPRRRGRADGGADRGAVAVPARGGGHAVGRGAGGGVAGGDLVGGRGVDQLRRRDGAAGPHRRGRGAAVRVGQSGGLRSARLAGGRLPDPAGGPAGTAGRTRARWRS